MGTIEQLTLVAYNNFIIAGPSEDPANISKASGFIEAFIKIYKSGEEGRAKFISRGDFSGTHVREMQIWNLIGLKPEGKAWYLITAQGASQSVLTADNIWAYIWIDKGTFKSLDSQGKIRNIKILFDNISDPLALNIYSLYASKAKTCEDLKRFILKIQDYIWGPGQVLIKEKYSPQGLFYPAKDREDELKKAWESLAKLSG